MKRALGQIVLDLITLEKISVKHVFFCFGLFVLASCGTMNKPYYNEDAEDWSIHDKNIQNDLIHFLYLIGDADEFDDKSQKRNYVLEGASSLLKTESVETSLVFLRDNIYPNGLPKKDDLNRKLAESILDAQINLSKSHDGNTYFIAGNHDWNNQSRNGRKAILRQEKYIKEFNKDNKNLSFFPKDACGDPKLVKINKDLVYVFLDSQWWLQDWSGEKK